MSHRHETGLITPPYSSTIMDHYSPSAKSNTSIADLCAQTVCFLWFESLPTLHEAATSNYPHHTKIPDIDNMARPEFMRWTRDVLNTTQVSSNVVILAMLYIYRLKIANPAVKGKPGSEYRLLTVALMLGNKFLDDNTYTNKTWAEVTSIAVKEIHLMEVEFLSNMRYKLMVTVEEWHQWLQTINLFVRYQRKQQTMERNRALSIPKGIPSPPLYFDNHGQYQIVNDFTKFIPARSMTEMPCIRSRKRSIGDLQAPDHLHTMLPPTKKILSQPSTPGKSIDMILRSRAALEHGAPSELSPSKRQQLQASMLRILPPPSTKLQTQSYFPMPLHGQHSNYGSNISPSYLQVGHIPQSGSSPTTSSASHISSHSHGVASGYSPTSLAMQYRNSPYAPVQPVDCLVGRYQPIFHSSQIHPQSEQSLWYNQMTAGTEQPVFNGHVPLATPSFIQR